MFRQYLAVFARQYQDVFLCGSSKSDINACARNFREGVPQIPLHILLGDAASLGARCEAESERGLAHIPTAAWGERIRASRATANRRIDKLYMRIFLHDLARPLRSRKRLLIGAAGRQGKINLG